MAIKSMNGKVVDMAALRASNERGIAVGNAHVNSRGDRLGAGGKVVQSREEIVAEYYRNNPKAVEVTSGSLRSIDDEGMTPADWIAAQQARVDAEAAALKPKKKIILSDD